MNFWNKFFLSGQFELIQLGHLLPHFELKFEFSSRMQSRSGPSTYLEEGSDTPSRNNIEQEVLLLLADEYHPTCAISMTNRGSLNMGFSEADPRQLVSSVGTPQVGVTILAAPSP